MEPERAIEAMHAFVEAGVTTFDCADIYTGVESLIGWPWSMSHGAFPPEEKRRKGISEATVRLSVGIEHVDDLCDDLDRALPRAGAV